MAGKHFIRSGALAALAAGVAMAALPSAASAQDQDREHGRHGGWQQGGGNGGGSGGERGNGGGWQARSQVQPQVQAQPQVQPAPRVDRGDTPGRGWGSARTEGQRYGRDWSNGGVVNRPDAASRNRAAEQAQQAPQQRTYADAWRRNAEQQQIQRQRDGQRTYADAWRNRSYTPQQYDGRQQAWGGQNWDRNRTGDRRWDGDRRWSGDRSGSWNRDWRRDNRYSWQSYRNQHRDVFRIGRYYSPYNNWSYRRLGVGFFLQPLFFSQDYWIDDPWMYRLPEAYGPYRWVRYYDDALLVDIYSGEVVDVIYDFFW
ncbi:MAG TPA: RcnB family protein [Novosphingobium sp.]|nr:RcnB family protein [Novosphingobium sp.]